MGPLKGIRILEFAGLGAAPFAGMMLADLGATVILIDKISPKQKTMSPLDITSRGKKRIYANLKNSDSLIEIKKMIPKVDAIIEGYRPGVMERLGLGPDELLKINPKLVYGRMTGWGQTGPLAKTAGHDLNYIAITGALHAMGKKGSAPSPPLNLIGDYGGGAMFLSLGVLAAIIEARQSNTGQIVDAAMVDGSSMLMSLFYSFKNFDMWKVDRESNLLDGGAHFYNSYECADGKYIAIGSIEPQFYKSLLEKLEITDKKFHNQMDSRIWPELTIEMSHIIKTKSREEWCGIFEGTDCCVAPVLTMDEAPENEHLVARNTFTRIGGITQPSPAPRFSRTQTEIKHAPLHAGESIQEVAEEFGLDIRKLTGR